MDLFRFVFEASLSGGDGHDKMVLVAARDAVLKIVVDFL